MRMRRQPRRRYRLNETAYKTFKVKTMKGNIDIEVEHDVAGVFVDVILNKTKAVEVAIEYPTGEVNVTQHKKRIILK